MPEARPIYPKHFFEGPPVPRARTGFILMPFKEEFEPVHEAIRTAIENAGLEPLRADDIFTTGAVLEKILRHIAEAEVVVADLTGKNANVFYETGIAHTVKNNVVLLAQVIEDIPVDLRPFEYIVYRPDPNGLRSLSEDLRDVIAKLEPEPISGQTTSTKDMSPAEIRSDLRRLLQVCEREWLDSVIPGQTAVFKQNFREPLSVRRPSEERDALIEESITAIQPAFLRPWQPIEKLGFEVIEDGKADVLPKFIEALARAYNLRGTNWNDVSTVWGHGQLLALRTWNLWGAKALECENWDAVTQLLHHEVAIHNAFREEIRTSFCRYHRIHFPDAAALQQGVGNARLASRSVYHQTEEFARTLFYDLAEMQAYVGLWLFAVDLAHAVALGHQEDLLWPSWFLAPRIRLNSLLSRIETDVKYAQNFARAVAQQGSATLNLEWRGGLRARILDRNRLGSGYHPGVLEAFKLPKHFAE